MYLNINKVQFTSVIQNFIHFLKMFLKIIKFSQMMLLDVIIIKGDQKRCLKKRVNAPNKKNCYFEKDCKNIFKQTLIVKNKRNMKQAKKVKVGLTNLDKIELVQ